MRPCEIKSHCVPKRAFEVAAVADLRVLLVGPLGTSKSTLRGAFPAVRSGERETCFCGHFGDVARGCVCTREQLIRWYRRLERTARDFDMIVECCPVPAKELLSQRPPDPHDDELREQRIAAAREFGKKHTSVALRDDAAIRTMEMATRRLMLTAGQYQSVLRVARAIANLDASPELKAKHVAEAVQYRADATTYRLDRVVSEVAA